MDSRLGPTKPAAQCASTLSYRPTSGKAAAARASEAGLPRQESGLRHLLMVAITSSGPSRSAARSTRIDLPYPCADGRGAGGAFLILLSRAPTGTCLVTSI